MGRKTKHMCVYVHTYKDRIYAKEFRREKRRARGARGARGARLENLGLGEVGVVGQHHAQKLIQVPLPRAASPLQPRSSSLKPLSILFLALS